MASVFRTLWPCWTNFRPQSTMNSSPSQNPQQMIPSRLASNAELIKCIEDLRERRDEVQRTILAEEEEKARIQKDISLLTDRLSKLNESLVRKVAARNEYDKTIMESEQAFSKILESSQNLLSIMRKELDVLGKKRVTHA